MKRMFELMISSELNAPVIESDSNSFAVTLNHETIYTQEQMLWLDQFDDVGLSREQKAIVVLGMDDKLVAPQDILDSLGIVDTERYRQLVKSLQDLQILSSGRTRNQASAIARKRRVSVRDIPRFKISLPAADSATAEPDSANSHTDSELGTPKPEAQIYIGNIPYKSKSSELLVFLSSFGTVTNIYVPSSYTGQGNRGFAFAEFSSRQEAEKAMSSIAGSTFDGRVLRANWSTNSSRSA